MTKVSQPVPLAELQSVLSHCHDALDSVCRALANNVRDGKEARKLDRKKFDAIQPEAFGLARLLAQEAAAQAMLRYAQKISGGDGVEVGLALVYGGEFALQLQNYLFGREERFGLGAFNLAPLRGLVGKLSEVGFITSLAAAMAARGQEQGGTYGISSDHQAIREAFSRFATEQLKPLAERIHRDDELIPEAILKGLAELGVFGISIPQEYGGAFIDHRTMILATEELSVASLGAGGSVITRPEICAKAIVAGGSEAQKKKWLPAIASGERMVCVAVTEPNAGSDVANVSVTAKKVPGGYVINGEKTWATFAGRADLFILLARTGGEGHKGLTLFLVEKPPFKAGDVETKTINQYAFEYRQEGGAKGNGKMIGHAIPTIGYRGMHSFAVGFEDWFVPEENRVGPEGEGFILQMKGFAGGRIQTAARALGVMEAAFREAMRYTTEREVFSQTLNAFPLIQQKLVGMAARVQAGRQLAYHVGDLMDQHQGEREASLVKFLVCGDSEWVTREAMQVHGGMGYSEEYAVSRYWCDARVLSIFEGAEEVLALAVIARQTLTDYLKG